MRQKPLEVVARLIGFFESGQEALNGNNKQLAKIWLELLREVDEELPKLPAMYKLGEYLGEFE